MSREPSSQPRHRLLSPAAAAVGALLAPLVLALPAASAHAQEVSTRPADGLLVLQGRGFGHGRGMSQWGAYGAADAGLSWPEILRFYYPGAVQARLADSTVRVWVSRDNDGSTTLPPQAGLTATVGRTTLALPTGPTYTAWRARGSSHIALQYRDAAGAWRDYRLPGGASSTLVFAGSKPEVTVTMPGGRNETFAGSVQARVVGGKVLTIVATTMERYLRGVVPSEMPTSWHADALAAQSVAARTYAASYRARKRAAGSPWDICDTITCQVYQGVGNDSPRANAAIAATAGTVLRTGTSAASPFVHAEFSASNGGHTVDGGAFSQVAKPDPYDGRLAANPVHTWSTTVDVTKLERAYGLGTLTTIRILRRDGLGELGGRVGKVRLEGTAATKDVTGAQVRATLGLRSDWFTLGEPAPALAARRGPALPAATGKALSLNWVGDRRADILTVRGGRLYVARGHAGGLSTPQVVPGTPTGLSGLVGSTDANKDKRTDVIALDSRGRRVILLGDGRGAVAALRR